jgi:hypothetical protein
MWTHNTLLTVVAITAGIIGLWLGVKLLKKLVKVILIILIILIIAVVVYFRLT